MSIKVLKEELELLLQDLMTDEPEEVLADSSYGMIALEVPRTVTNEWGVSVKHPHITIGYFPIVNAYMTNKISRVIQKELEQVQPIEITTLGQDWFGPEKDTRVVLVRPSYDLIELKNKIWNKIDEILPGTIDKKYKEYKPHITIGKRGQVPENLCTDRNMNLDTIVVGIKDRDTYKIPLRRKCSVLGFETQPSLVSQYSDDALVPVQISE